MFHRLRRALRDEGGITALETAIILIAFVVVASVFAFTVLSAGTTTTERGKEAILSGLEEVSSSLELLGSVLATDNVTGTNGTGAIKVIEFTVGNVAGGSASDLTDTFGETPQNKIVIDYRDAVTATSGLEWRVTWPVTRDNDNLLEDGELAKIAIDLSNTAVVGNNISLSTDTAFSIEVKPPRGGVLLIQKTTPSYIDAVIDFN